MAGAIILDIAYGIKVKPQHDPFIETAEGGLEAVTTIASIEAQIFDLFPARMSFTWEVHDSQRSYRMLTSFMNPVLKLPSWLPGVGVSMSLRINTPVLIKFVN